MTRYYTRVCNFYYGSKSKTFVEKNKSLPLHGIKEISFNQIEIITRKSKKIIFINQINKLSHSLKKKINSDLKKITSKKKSFCNLLVLLNNCFFFWILMVFNKLSRISHRGHN